MEDETVNNIICQFTDPEGTPLKAPLYIPQNAGPRQIVNKLLNNVNFGFYLFSNAGSFLVTKQMPQNIVQILCFQEGKLPHAFSISDQGLVVPLETYLQKNNGQ